MPMLGKFDSCWKLRIRRAAFGPTPMRSARSPTRWSVTRVEASPRGGQVRFTSRGDATLLRWTVEDGGHGITPEEGEHLFDPFYCGRQAGRGLGMGLPRMARFLGKIGGEVRVHSSPGQGSIFQARVPLTAPPKPRALEPDSSVVVSPAGTNRPATA